MMNGMRQPQLAERLLAHRVLHDEDDGQRDEQAERRRDLDEARVEPAAIVGHVLGDVHRRAAVLAAERQPLQHADEQQRNRRRDADGVIRRQESDGRRRAAHDEQRHQEGALAADEIADAAEEQRAERPHDEADGEGGEIRDEGQRVVAGGIEERRDDRGQAAEDIEVVPLDHRADGGRGDDLPDPGR